MNSTKKSQIEHIHKNKFIRDLEAQCNQRKEQFKIYVNKKLENSTRAKIFVFPKGMYIIQTEDMKAKDTSSQCISEKDLKLQKIKEWLKMKHEQNNLQKRLRKTNKSNKPLVG